MSAVPFDPEDFYRQASEADSFEEVANDHGSAPPHSVEAEGQIVGAILYDGERLAELEELGTDEFYAESHRRIIETARRLRDSEHLVDVVTIAAELSSRDRLAQAGGMAYLTQLVGGVAVLTPSQLAEYVRIVREAARARRALALADRIRAQVQASGTVSEVESEAAALFALSDSHSLAPESRARPRTPSEIAAQWETEGQLVRIATGFPTLDDACRGGLPIPWRVVIIGAPSAGKSAIAMVLVQRWATDGGLCVGVLGVDEEPDDLNVRAAQQAGFTIAQCELRDPCTMREIATALASVRVRFYDSSHTIEAAADDLAGWAASDGRRAALFVDSLQTARADASGDVKSLREQVDVNLRSIRAKGTEHRMLMVATSEANRGSYRDEDAADRASDMAAGKESGSIEFSAQTLIMVRTPKGHADVVHLRVPKNRRGARAGFEFFLRLDRDRHRLTECPDPAEAPGQAEERDQKKRSANKRAVERDALDVLRIIAASPGIGTRGLRAGVKLAGLKLGHGTLDAVVLALLESGRVENRPTIRGDREDPHYFASSGPGGGS